MKTKIPLVDLKTQYKSIKSEINPAIKKIVSEGTFILGNPVEMFEKDFATYLGAKYVIGVSSGTDALHLALLALGVTQGDEIITTPHTFIATAEAIIMCCATPVFVDIDPKTYTINPHKIEEKITKKTKGIIPVHLYGQVAEMNKINRIAKKNNLFVLEDAAQAHGATYKGKKVGILSDAGIFSFFPAKNLGAYGDGGAVVTNKKHIADRVRLLRNHGRKNKYSHTILGFGNRLDALQAAILRVKLKHLDEWNKKRQEVARLYNVILASEERTRPESDPESDSGRVVATPPKNDGECNVYHQYVIRVKNRDVVRLALQKAGIETGIHYPLPLHLQPALRHLGYKKGDFPHTEKACREILSLPMYPELSKKQILYVTRVLRKCIM